MEIVVVFFIIITALTALNIWMWRVHASRAATRIIPSSPTEDSLLRRVIDVIPDYIFVLDSEGRYQLSNLAYYRLFNIQSMQEIIGKTPADFLSKKDVDSFQKEDEQVRKTLLPLKIELPSESNPDQLGWQQVTKMPMLDSNNNVEGIVAIIRDITEAKRIENSLQERIAQFHLLSHIDNEISSTLHMGRVTMFALDMLIRLSVADAGYIAVLSEKSDTLQIVAVLGKYTRTKSGTLLNYNEGIIGRIIRSQKPELVRDVTLDADYVAEIHTSRALIGLPLIAQDRLVGIIRLETSHPERFTLEGFAFAQLVAARIALAVDNARLYTVVEQKLDETEKLYEEVKNLEQVKTDMIRIASHDLKNPLAVIEGYLMILQMEAAQLDDSTNDMIHEMSRAAQRMSKILLDILSLEKITQRAKGDYEAFNIGATIQTAYEEFLRQAEAKKQTFALIMDHQTPFDVKGDEEQLHEAVANLIGNAIKYTPESGSITMVVEVASERLLFRVVDSGYGIPQEYQERLFQPFYRARTDETRMIEGTGLGLHLVKNIIERHHGTMIFSSVYGKGSTFGFELPLSTAAGQAENVTNLL